MRIPQQPRSRTSSHSAAGSGRPRMPARSPSARDRARRPAAGDAPSAAPGKAVPRRWNPPFPGRPGWFPPDWRWGIVRPAPPPELGPSSVAAGSKAGAPGDAVWQAPTPLNRVAPATGPGLFVIERRTGSQWTRAYVGMSASGVGEALRWIARAPRILGVQADLADLRVRIAEAPFNTATPEGRETLRRWHKEVAGDDRQAGAPASPGSVPTSGG